MKTFTKLVAAAGLMIAASSSQAALTLTLDDSATAGVDVSLNDAVAGLGNITTNDGILGWDNTILGGLTNWTVATSHTVNQANTNPLVHFDANVKSKDGTNSTLTVTMVDDSFTLSNQPLTTFVSTMTGTGNLAFDYVVNVIQGGVSTTIAAYNQISGAFADTDIVLAGLDVGTYTLEVIANFYANGTAQQTSIDTDVAVPAPAPLALLGLGLVGMGLASRRKAQ